MTPSTPVPSLAPHRSCRPSCRRRASRGFTLIELLTVVAILGILAAVAIGGYMRNVKSAHKSEVLGDLSNLSLREANLLAVNGHYASTTRCESSSNDCVYPALDVIGTSPWLWGTTDTGYTKDTASGANFRGGGVQHGFDALRFMPQNGRSLCGYGVISGWGQAAAGAEVPTGQTIGDALFPTGTERFYQRDWYYAFALCDFDNDDIYWAMTTAHYSTEINTSSLGTTYIEGE